MSHAEAHTNSLLGRYQRVFCEPSSAAVVSAARFEALRAHPALGGWYLTDCATAFTQLPGERSAGHDELVIETSGTTGQPKLVRYRKDVIADCAAAIARAVPLTADRQYIALVNPRLAYGMSIIHSHLLADVPVRFEQAPVSADAWTEFRRTLRPTSSVYLVPHQSVLMTLDPDWRFDGPIEFIFAGGGLTASMAANLRSVFPDAAVVNMYGQAELGPRISIGRSSLADFREGDVGRPLPGVEVRIAGASASGESGALEVATPFQMSSYFDLGGGPESRPPTWWPTGDIGLVSPTGDVRVTGRDAPDVNFLGSRIALSHLRSLVRDVEGVLDCRVSATDHAVYGQQPSIRVLTDVAESDLERRVRKALAADVGSAASAMLITVVDVVSLPDSGKL